MSATSDSTETAEMLRQARSGNTLAFEELFAKYRDDIRRAVDLRFDPSMRGRLDASDIVQEAHFEAFRRLEDYFQQRRSSFRMWLRRIAYQRLLNLRRDHVVAARRSVRRELPLPDASSVQLGRQLVAKGATPSEQLSQREMAVRVRRAIAELSEADREIVLMRNFEGLSNQEVAEVLQLDSATTSKRYGRALLRLREVLLKLGVSEH